MVGGSLEFIFHKGVAAQLYQLGWRNKWPLHTWGCRLYTFSDQYKKKFYLQLRVCVSYLDVSSNERFLASLGCLLKYLSLRSCSSQRDQSPTYCILEFIHYSSQVVSVLSLFAKSPCYLCNRTPTDRATAHPGWKFRAALANRTPRGPKPPSGHLRVHSKLPPPLPCSRTLGYVNQELSKTREILFYTSILTILENHITISFA